MHNSNHRHGWFGFLAGFGMLAMFFFSGCHAAGNISTSGAANVAPGRIAVLPFKNMAAIYGENRSVRCPICGNIFTTGPVPNEVPDQLSLQVYRKLKKETKLSLIAPGQARGVISKLLAENAQPLSPRLVVVEAGRALNASAVLDGYVYRYLDRKGTALGVEAPASVAFGMHLVDSETGKILWSGHFDETQQSLSENLLQFETFVQRGGGWVTAEEMAAAAVAALVKEFPQP